MTASHVDRRTRLYKSVEQKGAVLNLAVEREQSGRISRETVAGFLDRRMAECAKRIEPRARETILARAGGQLWGIHHELEKLLLHVGEEAVIRLRDVEEVFLDQAENWAFDLTDAIAERDSLQALDHLARLLGQGDHPLRLLGVIASQVRLWLRARQMIEGELRGSWRRGMGWDEFQKRVVRGGSPPLPGAPFRNYRIFTTAQNFTMRELIRDLRSVGEVDNRLKSSAGAPRLIMERLVLEMCRGK